jgi:hypothetical protein
MDQTTNSSTSSADTTATFTPNETKLICTIMQNLTSEIQVSQSPSPSAQSQNNKNSNLTEQTSI